MAEDKRIPVSYWLVSAFAFAWNGLGMLAYFMQVTATPAALSQMYDSPEQLAFIQSIPAWAIAGQATAVTAGLLGAVAMFLRRAIAKWLFVASLLGVLVQNAYGFIIANGIEVFGMTALVLPGLVILIAIALIVYVSRVTDRGWLR